MARYGETAKRMVEKEVSAHERGGKWKSRKQAIAVGLNEARERGADVPAPPKRKK